MNALDYLKKLEKAGFEAYIVGGYVRDMLLGINTTDVDIATSATPKTVCKIFNMSLGDDLGCINIKHKDFNIDITTFRKESRYFKHRPRKVSYVADLLTDLKRRDFTINTICLNSNGEVIDLLNAKKDLQDKLIKVVGNPKKKFKEDPLRMLRALRFSIIYQFNIADKELEFMLNHKDLFKEISYERKKEELGKILVSKYCISGLELLKNLNFLSVLGINYKSDIKYVHDYIGMWVQLECDEKYPFNKNERARMKAIKSILNDGKIDKEILFMYGKYDALVAAEILNIDKNEVEEIYKSMPIHTIEELNINGKEIKEILKLNASPLIKTIKKDLLCEVLSGNLSNENKSLKAYILKKWK